MKRALLFYSFIFASIVSVHTLCSAPEIAEPDTTVVYQTKYNPSVSYLAEPVIYLDLLVPDRAGDVDNSELAVTGLPEGASYGFSFALQDKIVLKGPWLDVGVYPVTVTYSNLTGSDSVSFDLEVVSGVPVIDIVQEAIELDIGEPFKRDITFSGAGSIADNAEAELIGDLPNGLSLEVFLYENQAPMSVSISGAPIEEGVFPLTVLISNDYGEDSQDFTIYVGVEPPSEQTIAHLALGPSLNEFTPGLAYSQWFGFVFTANAPWVYNYELGWFYIFEGTTSDEDVWLYHVGNPDMGWMYTGSQFDGFFYYELTPGNWGWQWLYTGAVDFSTPENPPAGS